MNKKKMLIPDLSAGKSLAFLLEDFDINGFDQLELDFNLMDDFQPFGMLLVGAKIRSLIEKHGEKIVIRNHKQHSYAGHMGFFKSCTINFGKEPGEASGSASYLPVTKINIRDLRLKSYEEGVQVQDTIESKSQELANVLCQNNKELAETLAYSIRELMRNIVEHSDSDTIWFAAQRWRSKNLVEIALLDEGVGIKQALSVNSNLKISNDGDAMIYAMQPGISGRAFRHKGKMRRQSGSKWDNSGYGLYVTSEITQKGGNFIMVTGETALLLKDGKIIKKKSEFKGTAIRMRMDLDKINKFGEELVDEIVAEGEKLARKNRRISVASASKVTRISK
jgi:hypothetical protein